MGLLVLICKYYSTFLIFVNTITSPVSLDTAGLMPMMITSMTQLSTDQVRHIAKLARLRLTDEEVERFTTELTSIFNTIDVLQKVDTKDVPMTAQVTGLENAFRDDEITSGAIRPEDLLNCSPLPIVDRQIQTSSAHG
jgi:aspartyl-tRNA(Asn)/glutamyl-tRNA(Gln) amidotransferase subunit C